MSVSVVLPLVLLVLVVLVLVLFVRKASVALARVREVAAFQRESDALARRLGPTIEALIGRLDAVRHQQVPAGEVRAELAVAHAELMAAREAIDRWRTPRPFLGIRGAIAEDLDRLGRALEMVDFGTNLLDDGERRQREMEAQTAIKRGYLDLQHARQSLAEHVAAVPTLADAAAKGWRASRM